MGEHWRDNTTHSVPDVDTPKAGAFSYTPVAHHRVFSDHATARHRFVKISPILAQTKMPAEVDRVSSPLERI